MGDGDGSTHARGHGGEAGWTSCPRCLDGWLCAGKRDGDGSPPPAFAGAGSRREDTGGEAGLKPAPTGREVGGTGAHEGRPYGGSEDGSPPSRGHGEMDGAQATRFFTSLRFVQNDMWGSGRGWVTDYRLHGRRMLSGTGEGRVATATRFFTALRCVQNDMWVEGEGIFWDWAGWFYCSWFSWVHPHPSLPP